jgi:Flp pilus assembly protein CpaB
VKVLVAKKRIPGATEIKDPKDWLHWSEVEKGKVPQHACTALEQAKGVVTVVEFEKGKILTRQFLMPPGFRAIGISLPTLKDADVPLPWSRVDIYLVTTKAGATKEKLMFKFVLCIAVDYEINRGQKGSPVMTVVLNRKDVTSLVTVGGIPKNGGYFRVVPNKSKGKDASPAEGQ